MRAALLTMAAAIASPVLADDLTGQDRLLCSVLEVTACSADGDCAGLAPEDLNIPRFIVVDVAGKQLRTTPASGEDRRTSLSTVRRTGGLIVLQGYEAGRAFSLVIQERTGRGSFASAAEDRSVLAFAACTPEG